MKLSARTRYAARLLLDLAQSQDDKPICASLLSENTDISVQFIEQILRPLKKAGYIKSLRGAGGGHILKVDPADISIGDIVRAMEGPVSIAKCGLAPDTCDRTDDCRTRAVWLHISNVVERELDAITLADLVNGKSFG